MRTGTVLIAVVIGVTAGLGRMAYRNGLAASLIPPPPAAERQAVLDTVDRADQSPADGPAGFGPGGATPVLTGQRVEIQGQTARVHRTYANHPAGTDTHGVHSFTLRRADDGTWLIVQVVRHDPQNPDGPFPPEETGG
jgi:hypothetical protein